MAELRVGLAIPLPRSGREEAKPGIRFAIKGLRSLFRCLLRNEWMRPGLCCMKSCTASNPRMRSGMFAFSVYYALMISFTVDSISAFDTVQIRRKKFT